MNQDEIAVSVIMPIYNQEKYLEESLTSVQRQTLSNIEILCMDDGSTDATAEMLDAYAKEDPRIRVVHKENSGYGSTMNQGLDLCRGKYVSIVEPDDFISENMLQDLYEIAEANHTDFVKSDFALLEGEKGKYDVTPVKIYDDASMYGKVLNKEERNTLFKAWLATWTCLYRRTFLKFNNIRYHETPGASYQDTGFWFQTTALAERVYLHPQYYYHYRQDNPNSSMQSKAKIYCLSQEYDWIYDRLRAHGILEEYLPQYIMSRFAGARDTVRRLAPEYQLEFLWHTAGCFRQLEREGKLDTSFMWDDDRRKLQKIMESPEGYYQDLTSVPQYLHEMTQPYKHFYIYGAGQRGKAIYQALAPEDRGRCLGFLVTDERDAGGRLFGEAVRPLEYVTIDEETGVVLGVTERYREEMLAELRKRNIYTDIVLAKDGQMDVAYPKISVIVPVYNVERYLEACLYSIVTQDERDIEILCVDDGSTDHSPDILAAWAQRDPRIRVIHQKNSGLAAARNSGLANVRGTYVCFVDSDDLLMPGALKKLWQAGEDSGADIITYETAPLLFEQPSHRDAKTEEYYEVKGRYSGLRTGRSYFCDMMEGNDFVESACLLFIKSKWLRKEQLLFAKGRYYEDAVFALQCYLRCEKMLHIQEQLYCYRIRANSTMTSSADYKRAMDRMWVMKECLKVIYTQDMGQRVKGNIAKFACMAMWNLKLICQQMPSEDRTKLAAFPLNSLDGLLVQSLELLRTPSDTSLGGAPTKLHDRERLQKLLEAVKSSRAVILYGAGQIGHKVHSLLKKQHIHGKVLGFAVSEAPQKSRKEGLVVQEIARYAKDAKRKGTVLIVSANQDNQPDMVKRATKIGFKKILTIDYRLECLIDEVLKGRAL